MSMSDHKKALVIFINLKPIGEAPLFYFTDRGNFGFKIPVIKKTLCGSL